MKHFINSCKKVQVQLNHQSHQNIITNSRYLKNPLVEIMGVATKLGQPLDGPDLGPQAIRDGQLHHLIKEMQWDLLDHGDIKTEQLLATNNSDPNRVFKNINNSFLMGQMSHILHQQTHKATKNGNMTVVLGGDHGLATGSISGILETYPDLKIIWIDAHADINTPELSPSGNYHGMPIAHLMGLIEKNTVEGFDWFTPRLKPENLVFIGLRDIDSGEKKTIKDLGIKTYTMFDVTEKGISQVMKESLQHLQKDGKDYPIHISFDLDGCDPETAPGTGTLCRGGLNYREAQYIVRKTFGTGNLVSMDVVELNPLMDRQKEKFHGDSTKAELGVTAYLAIELILSGLGKAYL